MCWCTGTYTSHGNVCAGQKFSNPPIEDDLHEDEDGFSAPPQRAGVGDWNDNRKTEHEIARVCPL